jgi:hypothetical protein
MPVDQLLFQSFNVNAQYSTRKRYLKLRSLYIRNIRSCFKKKGYTNMKPMSIEEAIEVLDHIIELARASYLWAGATKFAHKNTVNHAKLIELTKKLRCHLHLPSSIQNKYKVSRTWLVRWIAPHRYLASLLETQSTSQDPHAKCNSDTQAITSP